MKTNKNAVQARINSLSKGLNVKVNVLLATYFFDAFLFRLSKSEYSEDFIFKGGFYLSAIMGIQNRYTKDLDFKLTGQDLEERNLTEIIKEIISISTDDEITFEFISITPIRDEDQYGGFTVSLQGHLENIKQTVNLTGMNVFDAIVDSIILVLKKGLKDNNIFNYKSKIENITCINQPSTKVSQKLILQSNDLSFSNIGSDFNFIKIYQGCLPIKEVVSFKQGIITGNNKLFISAEKNKLSKKVLTGSDFNKYYLSWSGKYVTYDFTKLHRPRTKEIFEINPKLLLRQTGPYPICMIDCDSYYTLDTVHNGIMINNNFDIKYVLALINSSLLKFLYNSSINETGKVFAQVKIMYIDPLPIKNCTREQQKPIIVLVDKILTAKKANPQADTSKEERKIDLLIYHLYGLNFDEAKLIDEELKEEEFNEN